MVPLLKDDAVTAHMEAARNTLKTWRKPVLVMFGDRSDTSYISYHSFFNIYNYSLVTR